MIKNLEEGKYYRSLNCFLFIKNFYDEDKKIAVVNIVMIDKRSNSTSYQEGVYFPTDLNFENDELKECTEEIFNTAKNLIIDNFQKVFNFAIQMK